MRSSRPARTIWQAADLSAQLPLRPAAPAQPVHHHHRPRRPFHASTCCLRRTKHHNITREEMKRIVLSRLEQLPSYTAEEKEQLKGRYNAAQMAAIEAAEEAIDKNDLASQAKLRQDAHAPSQYDDFSRIHPTIDFSMDRLQGKDRKEDPRNVRNMADLQRRMHVQTPDEMIQRVGEAMLAPEPEDADSMEDWEKMKPPSDEELRRLEGSMQQISEQQLREIQRNRDDRSGVLEGAGEGRRPATPAEMERYLNTLPEAERNKLQQEAAAKLNEPLSHEDTLIDEVDVEEQVMQAIESDEDIDEDAVDAVQAQSDDNITSATMAKRISRILSHYDPPSPSLAPEIPKINDPKVRWSSDATAESTGMTDDETAEAYARLSKQIGQTVDQIKGYRVKTLVSHRVVNQTRMGKIQSMYYLVVAGNENGMLGLGEGKSAEAEEALRAARLNAIRSLQPVRRYENRTIYGEVEAKVSATIVKLSSRRPGFGLRVNQHVFEIARCAGLQDLACRVPRSRNKMNVAKAVWKALLSQSDPEEIAKGRGRKLVDVRKVYYAGLV